MTKHTAAQFAVGTEIYYTGDMANMSGFGVVTKLHAADKWGYGEGVDLLLEDGREIRKIWISMFDASIGQRFHLKSEWAAKREAQISQMRAEYETRMSAQGVL